MAQPTGIWKKFLISAGIAVLALQTAAQVLDTGGALWPFMPYHMYSDVYRDGAEIVFYELRLDSETGPRPTPFTFRDAGLPEYKYAGLLRAAATGQDHLIASGGDGAQGYLARQLSKSGLSGRAELWELRYHIGRDGLTSRTPVEALVRQWPVPSLPER